MTLSGEPDILSDRIDRMACGKCGEVLDVSAIPSFGEVACPHCHTVQKVPALLGGFLLIEQLGVGGMGAVYRAMDQQLGRFVAIKVMKGQLGADPQLVESFLREARAAAALNHPNIVQIYSCGQEKGQPYIVMELVPGGRLEHLMKDGRQVPEVRLLEVALDVAEGLKAANGAGLVHGDIKPENILFDQRNTAKVVDFGLAQFVNRQQEQGGVWGTPYYISPERARGGKADHRSDIYSLGATMYHALAGVPPFDGKTPTDVVVARLKAPPRPLLELVPGLSPPTAALIDRMMAADPALRYPTSASLLADLRAALTAAREHVRNAGKPGHHKKQGSPVLVIGAVVLLLAILAAVVLVVSSKKEDPAPSPAAKASPGLPPATPEALEAAATEEIKEPAGRRGVLFFTEPVAASLASACLALTNGPKAMRDGLAGVAKQVPAASARLQWIWILQAVPAWVEGDADAARKQLKAASAPTSKRPEGHPVYMPQRLAEFLLGDKNRVEFDRASAEWPLWLGDLAAGLGGFARLSEGGLVGAEAAFDVFEKSTNAAPAWVFALRPAVAQLRGTIDRWRIEADRLLGLVEKGDLAAARAGVKQAAAAAPAYAQEIWKPVEEAIRAAEQHRETAEQKAAQARHRAAVEEEYARAAAVMATNRTLAGQAKDYRKAMPVLRALEDKMATPEGRDRARALREQMERMDSLKKLLIDEAERMPFVKKGGEVRGANVLGLRVLLPGRGFQLMPWEKVSPKLMQEALRFYIEETSADAAQRADRLISLAIFEWYNDALDEARTLVEVAAALDPAAAGKAKRLLPDLPPAAPAAAE